MEEHGYSLAQKFLRLLPRRVVNRFTSMAETAQFMVRLVIAALPSGDIRLL